MNKKLLIILLGIGVIIVTASIFYWQNLRGIWPLIKPVPSRESVSPVPSNTVIKDTNTTGIPLKLPPGFSISIFAKDLPGARVMAFDTFGNMWVSQTSEGTISSLQIEDGKVTHQNVVFKNLNKPHGLAFDPKHPTMLYVAEETKISKIPTYSEGGLQKIIDLPNSGGDHFTRTLGFGPDDRLYVSIGSSCNVCVEKDNRRAKIFSMNADGGDFKEYARGLRNSVFFIWDFNQRMWATEMGRDLLGDDIPPDEINIIKEGGNYGWPNCYGKDIHDTSFDKNIYIRNPCMEPFETGSHVDLQAHSAPLGLAFVSSSNWPKDYKNDLIVAFHGSWNRSVPTGYKLVRIKLDDKGNYQEVEDFITGWANGSKVYGRPVDLVFGPDGNLYVSDDRAGLIYKISAVK